AALAASMAVLQKKLRGQRAALEKFNSAHLGELPQQQQLNLAALDHLYERLQGDQAAELDAMNRRADLLARSGGSGGGKLAALKQKLQALRLHYTDQYPDVVNLRREIAALESSGAGDAAAPGASPSQGQLAQIDARLSDLRSDESAVQKQIAAARGKLERLPLTNQRIEALSEGDSQTSGVYSALLTQYEEARVVMATAGKDGSPYVMLEPARAPRTSEGPKRLRFAVMLLVVCAVLAFAAMLLAERRDTTFHTLEELREFTSVPILATIPVINRRRDRLGRFLRVGALVAIVVCAVVILGGVGYVAGHGNQPVAAILAGGTNG
ncbi:MAG TPA: hypothetical protein VFX38_08745, partial [Gammaproteobacteria bacterium]|nr:hypothetical protein [Gammaproteobacteria bacterium]